MEIYKTSSVAALKQAIRFVDYAERFGDHTAKWLYDHLAAVKELHPVTVNGVCIIPYKDDMHTCIAFGAYNIKCCVRCPAGTGWSELGVEPFASDLICGMNEAADIVPKMCAIIKGCTVSQFPHCSPDRQLTEKRSAELEKELYAIMELPGLIKTNLILMAEEITAILMLGVEPTYKVLE